MRFIYLKDPFGNDIPAVADADGNLQIVSVDSQNNKINPASDRVIKDSFDETDLSVGVYSLGFTPSENTSVLGVGIYNNSQDNEVIFTINGLDIVVPPEKGFMGLFDIFEEISISGTSPNFDAVIME